MKKSRFNEQQIIGILKQQEDRQLTLRVLVSSALVLQVPGPFEITLCSTPMAELLFKG